MTARKITAFAVPVLNFSFQPDSIGMVVPPSATARFEELVPVTYGSAEQEVVVGEAKVYRKGSQLLADLFLRSTWFDKVTADNMIAKLYPATCLNILHWQKSATEDTITDFKVEGLILTPYRNHDLNIKTIGQYIQTDKTGWH